MWGNATISYKIKLTCGEFNTLVDKEYIEPLTSQLTMLTRRLQTILLGLEKGSCVHSKYMSISLPILSSLPSDNLHIASKSIEGSEHSSALGNGDVECSQLALQDNTSNAKSDESIKAKKDLKHIKEIANVIASKLKLSPSNLERNIAQNQSHHSISIPSPRNQTSSNHAAFPNSNAPIPEALPLAPIPSTVFACESLKIKPADDFRIFVPSSTIGQKPFVLKWEFRLPATGTASKVNQSSFDLGFTILEEQLNGSLPQILPYRYAHKSL